MPCVNRAARYRTHTKVNPEGDHDPKCDGELLESHQASPHFRGRNLRVIQWHGHAQRANPQTSDKPSAINRRRCKGRGLDDDADAENNNSWSTSRQEDAISIPHPRKESHESFTQDNGILP